MEPLLATIKRLFALSGNQCAFPGCAIPIVEDSGTITGIVCHIKARSKGGPRFDTKQPDDERHSYENLILLCSRHSKVIDSEPERYSVDKLREMKLLHEDKGPVEISRSDAHKAELLLKNYRAIYISAGGHVMVGSPGGVQASTVVINSPRKTVKVLPPTESVASSLSHRNYVQHLIDRYNKFASEQPGRKFKHGAIYGIIKNRYGAKWDLLPLRLFDALVSFLQQHVDRTRQGSINRGKGIPNYSTFDEYRLKYEPKQ